MAAFSSFRSYRVRPLGFKPSELAGLSERLLASHYENNYGGAVRRLNAIGVELAALDPGTLPGYRLNGLKREELIARNSAFLHELYFDSLGGMGEPAGALAEVLERDFGSVGRWRAEFTAMGKALSGGSGWVLLAQCPRDGRLVNQWAADHTHALADAVPLLALDMYEHAYHMDFGADAGAYVDAFLRNVDWRRVEARWRQAAHAENAATPTDSDGIEPEDLRDALASNADLAVLVDVRRRPAFDIGRDMIRGAVWHDPERVETWASALPPGRDIVVYCMYGLHVGQAACAALRARGLRARYMRGGIAAWHAIGGPVQWKTEDVR